MSDYVKMPKKLTAENGAKNLMILEFSEVVKVHCDECGGEDSNCVFCNGHGEFDLDVFVSWTTIKAIYNKLVDNLGEELTK